MQESLVNIKLKSIHHKHIFSKQKSFCITNSTFYPNNFNSNKPAYLSLKQNIDRFSCKEQNNKKYRSLYKIHKNNTNTSYLQEQTTKKKINLEVKLDSIIKNTLKQKKFLLEVELNNNLQQLNRSFGHYFLRQKQQSSIFDSQKVIKLKCNIKELKQRNDQKIYSQLSQTLNQHKLLDHTANTKYQTHRLDNSCIDSMFPYERYGPAIANYHNQLVMLGGFNMERRSEISYFHKYNFDKKAWIQINQTSPALSVVPCFHTIDVYKNYLILVGGIMRQTANLYRQHNCQICVYSFERCEWSNLRGVSISTRSHASTLFNNTLMIHGGLDDKQKHCSSLYFINLNPNSIQSSIVISTANKTFHTNINPNLAHHKLVNTSEVQMGIKQGFKYDGVFCFGGLDQEGNMTNQLIHLDCITKDNMLDVRFQGWKIVETHSTHKPQPRKHHTLNIINKKALILLMGGVNARGKTLNDVWIFNLLKLEWTQITLFMNPGSYLSGQSRRRHKNLQQGIAGHCTTVIGSKVYVFGGRKHDENKKNNGLWYLQTDVPLQINKKIKYQKIVQIDSIKSIKSGKNPKEGDSHSMWNFQC